MNTKFNPDIHHRHSIRLQNYDYSQTGLYFITLCVQNRECIFGEIVGVQNFEPLHHQRNEFQHIIPRSIGAIIRGFKIGVTKQIGHSVFQRNLWEHIIRDAADYARIDDYITNNPFRWKDDTFYNE